MIKIIVTCDKCPMQIEFGTNSEKEFRDSQLLELGWHTIKRKDMGCPEYSHFCDNCDNCKCSLTKTTPVDCIDSRCPNCKLKCL